VNGDGKLKSRKFWLTVAVGVIGVVANALGMPPEKWQPLADWLTTVLGVGVGGLAVVDAVKAVATAIVTKKNGGA